MNKNYITEIQGAEAELEEHMKIDIAQHLEMLSEFVVKLKSPASGKNMEDYSRKHHSKVLTCNREFLRKAHTNNLINFGLFLKHQEWERDNFCQNYMSVIVRTDQSTWFELVCVGLRAVVTTGWEFLS